MSQDRLNIKHIAPYLPYGLKWKFEEEDIIHNVIGLDIADAEVKLISPYNDFGRCSVNDFFPILRPIKTITQEEARDLLSIVFNCDEFVGLKTNGDSVILKGRISYDLMELTLTIDGVWTYLEIDDIPDNLSTSYLVYEWLFKHHFDVFQLIDKGLAIDKNTIEL